MALRVPAQLAAGSLAAAIVIATPVIMKWEGKENIGYADKLAGNLPTACFGSTRGVKVGQFYTDAQCLAMLKADLQMTAEGTAQCLPERLPDRVRAAFISAAYNIGVKAFCGSSMARRAWAGDLKGACEALHAWNKARPKGVLQVIRGLVNRRADEVALCLQGVK